MNENKILLSKSARNKALAVFLMIISVFGFLVIIHRLSYYVFEYDPVSNPVDYGKFNILSYFTVQSNIFTSLYLFIASLAVFGNKRAARIAFNPTVGALVTTYIIMTGLVYCCGIPLGFTPAYLWDTPNHAMLAFIQIFHHMIVPPLTVILWLFPFTNEKISKKGIWKFGIYPFVYSIFSIVRGGVSKLHYYPYPFYRPDFITSMFPNGDSISPVVGYLLMIPLLIVGIALFIGAAAIVIAIHNKRIEKIGFGD